MPSGDAYLLDSNIPLRISKSAINVRDFRRFNDLRVLHPAELSRAP